MKAAELKDKYRDRVIKVSFGTGFIYCGKVDDGFIDLLKRADAEYVAKAEKRKVHAGQALDKCKKEIKRLPGVVDNLKTALERKDLIRNEGLYDAVRCNPAVYS